MAGNPPDGPRDRAIDEIERLRLKVTTLGVAAAQLVQTQGDNATTVIDGALDPAGSVADTLHSLTAFWVETVHAQLGFWRDVCMTIQDPPPDPDAALSGVFGNELRFALPTEAQAADPLSIDVPVAEQGQIQILGPQNGGSPIPPENIYVSLSSNRKSLRVALVNLTKVEVLKEAKSHAYATLIVQGASFTIHAFRIR